VRLKFALLLMLVALLLNACGQKATEVPPTVTPTNTPIPLPTFTPTPSTPLVILVLPADMDPAVSSVYQTTVYNLAQQSGFRFQVRNSLIPSDLADPTLKIVVALPPDPGIAALASSAPQAQFLAVNIANIAPGGNVSVLSPNTQVEMPAFMAGYVAAMITEDYRIGMLYPKDNPDAQRALKAFQDGMIFYCGSCKVFNIFSFPFCVAENLLSCFPQNFPIPSDEDPARYGGYVNYLINDRYVNTLYVYSDLVSDELLTYIGTIGALQIGITTPNPMPAGWVMTVQPDVIKAIELAWPNLAAGQGGVTVQSPLGLTDVDPALLSTGKQRLVRQVLEDLLAGRIVP
jgi:hypothetical protein